MYGLATRVKQSGLQDFGGTMLNILLRGVRLLACKISCATLKAMTKRVFNEIRYQLSNV